MNDTIDVKAYITKLQELRSVGKYDEAELLKKQTFGLLYGCTKCKTQVPAVNQQSLSKLNFSDVEIRAVVSMEPK